MHGVAMNFVETAVVKGTEQKEESTEEENEARKIITSSLKSSIVQCLSSPSVSHRAMKPNTATLRNSKE
jgi:hypothetical protein